MTVSIRHVYTSNRRNVHIFRDTTPFRILTSLSGTHDTWFFCHYEVGQGMTYRVRNYETRIITLGLEGDWPISVFLIGFILRKIHTITLKISCVTHSVRVWLLVVVRFHRVLFNERFIRFLYLFRLSEIYRPFFNRSFRLLTELDVKQHKNTKLTVRRQ